ncbi:MAG TPA: hypothetical protein VEB21_14540, partial [Terriglobales bacterium]|nr:hypothetical protein [Terriglobales bacterium]
MYRAAVVLLSLCWFAAMAAAAPLGTTFTYQGQLRDQGPPATGSYDLQFRLFDSLAGGAQIGTTASANDVAVQEGLFTVDLDFGTTPFAGEARYLEIAVRSGFSSAAFTTLAPRQRLAPAPYALHAQTAASVAWGAITGVPAGLADQVDNDTTYSAGTGLSLVGTVLSADFSESQARVLGTCAPGNSIRAIQVDGTVQCEPDDVGGGGTITAVAPGAGLSGGGSSGSVQLAVAFGGSGVANSAARSDHHHDGAYQAKRARTVVVSPAGDALASGNALLAAFAGITASSCSNPYLLELEPGVYDLGTQHLVLKECVDIEGSGEQTTVIQGTGSAAATTGTVVGANNVELRRLTVRSTGGVAAVAIHSNAATLRLSHVTAL